MHRRFIARSFSPRGSPRYYVIPRERNRLLSAKSESTQTCHARRHSYSEETSSFSPFDGRNSAHFAGIFSLVDDDNQSRWRFHKTFVKNSEIIENDNIERHPSALVTLQDPRLATPRSRDDPNDNRVGCGMIVKEDRDRHCDKMFVPLDAFARSEFPLTRARE